MSDCFGRWVCKCGNLNYPWYDICIVCSEPRPECEKEKDDRNKG